MPPEQDEVRLRHMLDAARSVRRFAEGRQREDLDTDEMLAFAIVRGLEVIGEAASQVSAAGRAACPDLPWASIIGMRHRLIHAYFEVDLDRVWDTVTDSIPPVIAALENLLEGQAEGGGVEDE